MKYETVLTTCTYCGCGCGLLLEVLEGVIIGTLPQKDHPVNEGSLCIKGWNVDEFIYDPGRLTTPLIREDGELRKITWEEAIEKSASRLKRIKETYGPESIGGLTSARCTNEENYLFQKLMRVVIGTNNIDHCARL